MSSARLSINHVVLTTVLAVIGTGCDAADRAVGPIARPAGPHFAASATSVLAPSQGYRKAITVPAIRAHQAAFQAIANQYGGVRSSMDASHDASAEYVRAQMLAAGYIVTVQPFQFTYGGDLTPPVFSRVSPNPTTFTPPTDFATMSYSGSGDVTAPVHNVDLLIPSPGGSTSGCEAADFAGFPAGAIALIQRGTCGFRDKVLNATAGGASAVIIMNEGNTPDRQGVTSGTVSPPSVGIPVIGTSYALGVALANSVVTPVVRIRVNAATGTASSSNVIAESPGGDANSVVVVGATLDGRFGPGINAASGGAAMIELARVFSAQERTPKNRMRFIWFGAYPEGFQGATHYVSQLSGTERDAISAMIDIGPIGSPNFGRFLADGDQSTLDLLFPADPAVDAASGGIEALFGSYFAASELPVAATAFLTNAAPFRLAGVPFGGLHTGTTIPKTAQEAALFGGTAETAFDPCSFLACDVFANVSTTALDQMSDATAHVVLLLSRRNFVQKPLAGSE